MDEGSRVLAMLAAILAEQLAAGGALLLCVAALGPKSASWPACTLPCCSAAPPLPPGSYVTHETKHFIYFYVGSVAGEWRVGT